MPKISTLFLAAFFFLILQTKDCEAARSVNITTNKSSLFGDEDATITAILSGFTDGETIYIKGAFYQDGTTNYFAYTKNGDSWVKNGSSTTSQRQVKIGEWDGNLTIKSDFSDSGYKGEGDYKLKIGFYYTTSGGNLSSVNWSANILDFNINEPDPTPTPTPSPSPSPTQTSSTAKSPSPSPISIKSPSPTPKPSPKVLAEENSQPSTPSAQQETPGPSPSPSAENPPSKFKGAGLLSGTGLALIGVSFALYLWYSKRLSKNENP